MEIWKTIKEFEDYEISSLGNVKSFKSGSGFILTPIIDSRGYYVINLCRKGEMFQRLIHRLVAIHFIENPNNYKVVNHKDFDKLNNKKENLEWCTTRHNVSHYYSNNKTSSDYLGVSVAGKKFRSQIHIGEVKYCFGTFENEKEASEIYLTALRILEHKGIEKMIEYQKKIKDKFTSKYKGVAYDKSREKWTANVVYKGKKELYKRFDTEEEAVKSVIKTYEKLGRPLHYTHTEYLKFC